MLSSFIHNVKGLSFRYIHKIFRKDTYLSYRMGAKACAKYKILYVVRYDGFNYMNYVASFVGIVSMKNEAAYI